jgi:hypothetical protein
MLVRLDGRPISPPEGAPLPFSTSVFTSIALVVSNYTNRIEKQLDPVLSIGFLVFCSRASGLLYLLSTPMGAIKILTIFARISSS